MDDDDIYGDLESSIFVQTTSDEKELTKDELKDKVQELEESLEQMKNELAKKDEIVNVLKEEKDAIAKNITSLYRTSMTMLEKKNYIIKSQCDKIKELTASKSKLSKNELDNIFLLANQCRSELIKLNGPEIQDSLNQSLDSYFEKKRKKKELKGECKRVKYKNFSVYFHQEQVPFTRNETVIINKNDKK